MPTQLCIDILYVLCWHIMIDVLILNCFFEKYKNSIFFLKNFDIETYASEIWLESL